MSKQKEYEIDWNSLTEIEFIVEMAGRATPKQFYGNLMQMSKMFKTKLK